MNPHKLQSFIIALILVVGAAWVSSYLVYKWLEPEKSYDLSLFMQLEEAAETGSIEQVRSVTSIICFQADDPDLKKSADLVHRCMNLYMSYGITELEEADSFTGLTKAFIASYENPVLGIPAVALLVELSLPGTNAAFDRVNQKFTREKAAYEKKQERASMWKNTAFWVLLVGGCFIFVLPILSSGSTNTAWSASDNP